MDPPTTQGGGKKDSPGRVMALDLGEKRIGVALSDETRLLATSHSVFRRTSRLADFERIDRIIDQNGVTLLIVGLPTLPSGEEGSKAAWVRDYASEMANVIGIKIEFWDESFSTVDAVASLRELGKRGKKSRQWVDAVAAAIILQSYLDDQT